MLRAIATSVLAAVTLGGVVVYTTHASAQTDKKQDPAPQQKKADDQKQEKPKKPVLARFMRKKLDASNKVLEGLMTDDFEMIEKASNDLLKISMQERWRISADPTYARFSREYRNTINKLKAKAKKGSTDGTALAWMDVSMSCIECHDWVRNMVIADIEHGSPLQ